MSRHNNVNPGHYKVAGRERQGENIVHEIERRNAKLVNRDARRAGSKLPRSVGTISRPSPRRPARTARAMKPMSRVQKEIAALEERLRLAELGPDPDFFDEVLADDAVIVSERGEPSLAKAKVVAAHRPGKRPKFTGVDVSDLQIRDHGDAAVVTCRVTFKSPQAAGRTNTLRFMRTWLKKSGRWQIVAASVSA